jgi:hypothetical protein
MCSTSTNMPWTFIATCTATARNAVRNVPHEPRCHPSRLPRLEFLVTPQTEITSKPASDGPADRRALPTWHESGFTLHGKVGRSRSLPATSHVRPPSACQDHSAGNCWLTNEQNPTGGAPDFAIHFDCLDPNRRQPRSRLDLDCNQPDQSPATLHSPTLNPHPKLT